MASRYDSADYKSGRVNRPGIAPMEKNWGKAKCKCGTEFEKNTWNKKQCDHCLAKQIGRKIPDF